MTTANIGRYWDDFTIGEMTSTPARTIEGWDVSLFAGLTGDFNPLHTDAEFARDNVFGQRIAHGLLTLAISSGLQNLSGTFSGTVIAFAGIDALRFTAPVFFGDTIRTAMTVTEKRETSKPDRGILRFSVVVSNQHGRDVLTYEQTLLMARRIEASVRIDLMPPSLPPR